LGYWGGRCVVGEVVEVVGRRGRRIIIELGRWRREKRRR
jgi:hypothetical protein